MHSWQTSQTFAPGYIRVGDVPTQSRMNYRLPLAFLWACFIPMQRSFWKESPEKAARLNFTWRLSAVS